MIGDIYKNTPVSAYQPPKPVAEFTSFVQKDYSFGDEILHRPWVELNNRSIIDDMDRGQRTFNAFVDESEEDPSQAWKWRGTRSKARNKAIALHAQLTAGYIIPMFMAQNENDEEDIDFSNFMREIVEWMVHNSNYKSSFLMVSMGMLMNPVNYLSAEFAEVFQKIKKKTDEGFEITEILDEVLSGFRAPVYSADQILISNAYEQNIQKQRFIIKRRYIDLSEAQVKYQKHTNIDFVKKGQKSIYNENDGRFYDVKDDDHPFLVAEEIYMNRRDDTEVAFLGGIYMGDDNIEANPIKHRDHRGAPKYNIVPFGYQRVNEHFFYYKSLMNSMYWDNLLIDAQYEMGMNRSFLDTNMPMAVSGTDKVDSEIVFPSAVIAFKDKDTKITPMLPQANLGTMFNAMQITEASMEESSISDQSAGQVGAPSTKATAVAIAERNARIMLLGVGKTLAESIVQYGSLMADIAVNNLSIPEIDEMLDGNMKLKYRNFILDEKTVGGKQVSKVLRFDESMLGANFTDKQIEEKNLQLLEETGYPENKVHLYNINPELFAKMRYLTRVEPERMFPKNEEFQQAIMSQIYAQFRNDPLVEPESLVRKVLHAYFRGEAEELIAKQDMSQVGQLLGQQGEGAPAPQTTMGIQAQNKTTAPAFAGTGIS